MRCDVIAEGIILAAKELDLQIPLIVRLQGTKEHEAKELIRNSKMKIFAYDNLDEGESPRASLFGYLISRGTDLSSSLCAAAAAAVKAAE
jgi:succinyl-CoA synthetase beta subunit